MIGMSIFSFTLCLIESYLFNFMLQSALTQRKGITQKKKKFLILSLTLAIFGLTQIISLVIVKSTLVLILLAYYSYLVFKPKLSTHIMYSALFLITIFVGDIVASNVVSIVVGINIVEAFTSNKIFVIAIISKSFLALFILFFRQMHNVIPKIENSNLDIKILSPTISFVSVAITYFSLGELNFKRLTDEETTVFILVITLGIFLLCISGFTWFAQMCKYYTTQQTNDLIELQNSLLEKSVLESKDSYEEMRIYKHDFNNYTSTMENLLENEKYADAKIFIKDFVVKNDEMLQNYDTGDNIIDAVLNVKGRNAQLKGITVDAAVHISKSSKIESADLCIVFCNLLDNAIEACEKVDSDTKKAITIATNQQQEMFYITISNTTLSNPIDENGLIHTTKKDKKNHGIGLLSVRSIVDKYEGFIDYQFSDEIFTVSMVLNQPD